MYPVVSCHVRRNSQLQIHATPRTNVARILLSWESESPPFGPSGGGGGERGGRPKRRRPRPRRTSVARKARARARGEGDEEEQLVSLSEILGECGGLARSASAVSLSAAEVGGPTVVSSLDIC